MDMTAGTRAAERLLEMRETLALAITEAIYARMPELMERHGEYGRQKCLQDMRYNVEHLAPAVDLGEPGMFVGYVQWLDGLLRARNVSTAEVVLSLELMEGQVRERFSAEEVDAIVPSIQAALASLSPREGTS